MRLVIHGLHYIMDGLGTEEALGMGVTPPPYYLCPPSSLVVVVLLLLCHPLHIDPDDTGREYLIITGKAYHHGAVVVHLLQQTDILL